MSLLFLVAAVVILGLVIGLTMLFNGLLQRGQQGQGLPPWLAVPLAFIAAVVVVVGVAWAVLMAVCSGSGSGFH